MGRGTIVISFLGFVLWGVVFCGTWDFLYLGCVLFFDKLLWRGSVGF